jgi:hypothetical protein
MSSQDLVAEGFKVRRLEGLGDVFVCRICDTIFVSANDALRHLQLYHKILSAVRLRQVLEEKVSGERRCSLSDGQREKSLIHFVK